MEDAGKNQRPLACKVSALPTGLNPLTYFAKTGYTIFIHNYALPLHHTLCSNTISKTKY